MNAPTSNVTPQLAVIETATLDTGTVLLFRHFGARVRAAYDPARLSGTEARNLLRLHVGDFTEATAGRGAAA